MTDEQVDAADVVAMVEGAEMEDSGGPPAALFLVALVVMIVVIAVVRVAKNRKAGAEEPAAAVA